MSRARHSSAWLLALALLLAQTLGLVHGQLHATAQQLARAHAHAELSEGAPAERWEALFDAHRSAADCRVFDQLSHGDAAASLPLLAPPPLPAAAWLLEFFQAQLRARLGAPFDARGPPPLR